MTERGGIRFIKPPPVETIDTKTGQIVSAGGLCAPIAAPYGLPFNTARPIRDALVQMMDLAIARMRLPEDERPAFDIVHSGFCVTGRGDVTARLAEHRYSKWDDDYDDEEEGDVIRGHRWDEPIRLVWVGRLGGR